MNRLWLISLVLLLAVVSCRKKETEVTKFPVTATQANNKLTLSWSAVTFSDFKNISIYRSSSPIPEPGFGKTVDASLQIGLISDRSVTSFVDSNMIMNATGTSYYKVVVSFGNRFITSDLITVVRNGFSMVMTVGSSGSMAVVRFPEIHKLYYIDYSFGTIRAIDYQTKTVTSTVSFVNSGSLPVTAINNGNPELFVISNTTLYCYNANTLALKYSFNISNSVNTFCVKNNYLYVATYGPYLYTYDLNTKSLINSQMLSSSIYSYSMKLFPGANNSIYFRYYNNYYNSSYGQYYYVNTVKIYRLAGGIPVDSARVDPAVLNVDSSFNSYSYSYINLSPDCKYLSTNSSGDMYSLQDHSMHNVLTSGSFSTVSYSLDGQYLVSRPNQTSTGYSVGVFALPGFSLFRTVRSGNVGSSSNVADDFTSHDTLISYNVTSQFLNGQFQTSLNVAFNKVN